MFVNIKFDSSSYWLKMQTFCIHLSCEKPHSNVKLLYRFTDVGYILDTIGQGVYNAIYRPMLVAYEILCQVFGRYQKLRRYITSTVGLTLNWTAATGLHTVSESLAFFCASTQILKWAICGSHSGCASTACVKSYYSQVTSFDMTSLAGISAQS